ncbi:chromogranin-A [Pezoporus flaviventris]|uniref:chromogranin-A n=1 Tax=Pezoporus flaviventris TaxID=889875 RepID=UPI002AB21B69|nr:chromogranin-A [Pezoporus flaviventris]
MSPLLQCPIWDFQPGHWRRHARTALVSPRHLAQKPPRQGHYHPLTFSPSIYPAGIMSLPGLLAVLLLAVPVISLPVTNDMNKGDTKVMKCIVEVISDTLSKPNPLPISEECLETLRGDERIISILRHQNLLKELQEIAAQGANERTQQQKKNSGFEDELSEVLESQNNKNKQRDAAGEHPKEEQPTGSLTELAAQKHQQNEDSREKGKNSLEEREPRPQDANPGEKEYQEQAESNEIRDTEDAQRDEALDNHTSKDFSEDEQQQQEDEEEQPRDPRDSLELEDEEEQPSRKDQEQSREAAGEHGEREDDRGDDATEEDPTEAERSLDLAEEDEEMQGDDNNDALGFGKDERSSEEEEEEEEQPRVLRGGRHHLEDEGMQGEEDTFQPRDTKSEEMEEEWEDSKRWNKMDELAKQLTSKKRMEENDSGEDPDRSMKMAFRSHKYDFNSPEEHVRRSWKHHSKEDSSEGGFPLVPMPEEKKDEEGSANRRTEDQELESLAAIEAELERVAHKLHELRRG